MSAMSRLATTLETDWVRVSDDQYTHLSGKHALVVLSHGAVALYSKRSWSRRFSVEPNVFGSLAEAVHYVSEVYG